MTRRKQGGFELIALAPWPLGLVLGIVAYVAVRYGISWYLSTSGNQFLVPIGKAANGGAITILAWTLLGICWAAALASLVARRRRGRPLETQTGLDNLRAMNWKQFEMLVGEAFRRQGYRIEETGLGGADGSIALHLSKSGKSTLVQCKQWRSQRVDVKIVREMYGLLAHHGADTVKIVAIEDFTLDAQRFAQGKPIELIHGARAGGAREKEEDANHFQLGYCPVSHSRAHDSDFTHLKTNLDPFRGVQSIHSRPAFRPKFCRRRLRNTRVFCSSNSCCAL